MTSARLAGTFAATLAMTGGPVSAAQAPGSATSRRPVQIPQAPEALPSRVHVSATLNRTAAWVGDRIVWTVELTFEPSVDVIEDDLAADKLELSGLELETSETERFSGPEGSVIQRVRYHLRPYDVGAGVLRAGPLRVRYYVRQPGQRLEDLAPAGEVQVPAALLAWRSTIPEGVKTVDLRYERAAEPTPAWLAFARPVGLALVLISIAPVLVWGASRLHNIRGARARRPSQRASRTAALRALERLRTIELETEMERREAYAQLSEALRQHLAQAMGTAAVALTTDEIRERFSERSSQAPVAAVAEILAECDRARYGPPGSVPPSDAFREHLATTERLATESSWFSRGAWSPLRLWPRSPAAD